MIIFASQRRKVSGSESDPKTRTVIFHLPHCWSSTDRVFIQAKSISSKEAAGQRPEWECEFQNNTIIQINPLSYNSTCVKNVKEMLVIFHIFLFARKSKQLSDTTSMKGLAQLISL